MKEFKVLDKGFVRLVESMGNDQSVIDAARVSYSGTSKGPEKDKKLLFYLMEHQHMTPFEQIVFKFHVKLPLFVARQWMRHRIACLAGDVELDFDLPNSLVKSGRSK